MDGQVRGAPKGKAILKPPEVALPRPDAGGAVAGRLEAALEEIDAVLERNAGILETLLAREPVDEGDA